jgi:hypothetical protein
MSLPRQDGPAPLDAPGPLDAPAPPSAPAAPGSAADANAIAIAVAVSAAPGVATLSGGRFGGVGTYLPGRQVTGIVIRDQDLEVHVVGRYGVPVAQIAAEVRRAVEPYAGDRTVHVIIEDLA